MTDPEFDQTKPKAGMCGYRVQRIDCTWSPWYDIKEKCPEDHILSIQITECVTKEQAKELFKQIGISNET